jgi:predicted metal-dependent peptidase
MYLPCTRQPRLRAVLAVDTSGSVHAILPEFAAELFALLASFGRYEVMVLWADDRVQRIAAFSDEDPPDPAALQVPLGGGTDFRPAFREVQAHQAAPDVFVYLTDGEGPAPDRAPPWPVLWALPARHHPPAPWGEAVHVEAWGGS